MSFLKDTYLYEWIIILLLIIIDYSTYYVDPYKPEFFEGDPSISKPYHSNTVGY